MTQLSWIQSTAATLAGAALSWIKSSATGTPAGTLSLNKATPYEPGETVTVTVTNGDTTHTWAVIGTLQPTLTFVGATVSFQAPATLDGVVLTVRYGASVFINVPILPAGVLVGPSRLPATVWVNV